MEPTTLQQLDEWMEQNCYNRNSYAIGEKYFITEGFGLERFDSLIVWYYTERGSKENINYFSNEKEAVEFALKQIKADNTAKSHLIGFLRDKLKEQELLEELSKRKIEFTRDEIPYMTDDKITRVFVFGCDIKKVLDLKERFIEKM